MPTAKYSNYLEINPSFESVVDIDAEVLHVNTEDVCRGHARAVRVVVGVHEVSECEAVAAGALRVEIQRIEQCGGVRVIPTGAEVGICILCNLHHTHWRKTDQVRAL